MLPAVVVTRVATSLGEVPSPEWTAARLPLIERVSAPSVRRLAGRVAWVWLCHPSRHRQVLEMAGSIEAPNCGIHVVSVDGMFDPPNVTALDAIHPGHERFLTYRLDSDDAFIGEIASRVVGLQADDRTMYDFACGYQLDWSTMRMVTVDAPRHRQGPFLACINLGRASMIEVGGDHRFAREGRGVVRIEERAWIQVVHGRNADNELKVPRPFARLRRLPVRSVRGPERDRVLAAAGVVTSGELTVS